MSAQRPDVGCLIDGRWGQYAGARLVQIADEYGWHDTQAIDLATRHLAAMGASDAPGLSDDEYEALSDATDDAERWLNEHVAADGFAFGWYDGELFYQSES